MIFIIPLILGAAAVVTGAIGIAAGAEGMSKMEQAKEICEAAEERYKDKKPKLRISKNRQTRKSVNTVTCKCRSCRRRWGALSNYASG